MNLTRTRDAIEEYDRLLPTLMAEGKSARIKELEEAVGIAFGEDTKAFNNPETCRHFIRPGPQVPGMGHELSFVRRAVLDWEERTARGEDTDYQPRYIAYARDHGRTPKEMLKYDKEVRPGGCMVGFLLWIPKAWAAWAKEVGEKKPDSGWSRRQHEAFDTWLASTDRDSVK